MPEMNENTCRISLVRVRGTMLYLDCDSCGTVHTLPLQAGAEICVEDTTPLCRCSEH